MHWRYTFLKQEAVISVQLCSKANPCQYHYCGQTPQTDHVWPTVQCGEDREETERELLVLLSTQSDTLAEWPNLTCFSSSLCTTKDKMSLFCPISLTKCVKENIHKIIHAFNKYPQCSMRLWFIGEALTC